ncbi:MAG: family 20 glycosylhydrolase [Thermoguttaceae bacterium]
MKSCVATGIHMFLAAVISVLSFGLVMPFSFAQQTDEQLKNYLDDKMPVRGLCLKSPSPQSVDRFVKFIDEELGPNGINTLILRVDFDYVYESHPELRSSNPLTSEDVKKLVVSCRRNDINLIPHFQILGHQSWAKQICKLLEVYPQFDETPHVDVTKYEKWPNPEGLYCKSYCPLHPDVHGVVYSLVDELMDAFEAKDFHGGMDEVFYIGDEKCPRCAGKDRSELFAGEVNKLADHLSKKNRRLWIWGDRLLNGKTTGLGEWEAAINDTDRAIDLIPKSVFICDWHYESPEISSVIFAAKGFDVVTCPWKKTKVSELQFKDMLAFRSQANPIMGSHFQGMMQTVWGGAEGFLDQYYMAKQSETPADTKSEAACFLQLLKDISDIKN